MLMEFRRRADSAPHNLHRRARIATADDSRHDEPVADSGDDPMNRKKTLNSILVIMALLNITAPATGQAVSVSDEPASLTEAIGGGKVDINLRLRFEFVDQTGLKVAAALTERIRIGYGTLPYKGFSF